MLRLALTCAIALAGCGSTDVVALSLSADPACTEADLMLIQTLSIEASAQNGACKVAHSCAFNVSTDNTAGLEDALRDAGDVLLELSPDEVQTISVNGRPRSDCFGRADGSNSPIVCGSANLSSISGGVLEIVLQCGGNNCIESLELCP